VTDFTRDGKYSACYRAKCVEPFGFGPVLGEGEMAHMLLRRLRAVVISLWMVPFFGITLPNITAAQEQNNGAAETKEFKGVVAPAREAEISPRFDGLLKTIHFVPGQIVEKGRAVV
jgi:multidrug efflux pump subunit AcrA (membrane-fusion protein)